MDDKVARLLHRERIRRLSHHETPIIEEEPSADADIGDDSKSAPDLEKKEEKDEGVQNQISAELSKLTGNWSMPDINKPLEKFANWTGLETPFQQLKNWTHYTLIPVHSSVAALSQTQQNVLGAILVVLGIIIFICLCKCCCCRKRRRSARSSPPENPQNDDAVIAEVVNRREPKPITITRHESHQFNGHGQPCTTTTINVNLAFDPRSLQMPPQVPNPNQPVPSSPSPTKITELPNDLPPFRLRSEGVRKAILMNNGNDAALASDIAKASKSLCTLKEPRPIKLIPVENLVIPRSFSDTLRDDKPPPLDRVLSLTKVEKSRSRNNVVLIPERNANISPSTIERISESVHITVTESIMEDRKESPADEEDILNPMQKEEERQKFFRACWKSEMRRRRSLCSTFADDLIDTKMYNSIVQRGKTEAAARKVNSMPAMLLQPFHQENESGSQSPTRIPSWHHYPSGTQGEKLSTTSSLDSLHGEWTNPIKSIPYSLANNTGLRSPGSHDATNNTSSKTSIWSTVASENALDVSQDVTSGGQDLDNLIVSETPGSSRSFIHSGEQDKDTMKRNSTPHERGRQEDPGDSLSESFVRADIDNNNLKQQSQTQKQGLTVAQQIEQSARSVGYVPEGMNFKLAHGSSTIALSTDVIPPRAFQNMSKESTNAVPDSLSNIFRHKDNTTKPWVEKILNEFDPCK